MRSRSHVTPLRRHTVRCHLTSNGKPVFFPRPSACRSELNISTISSLISIRLSIAHSPDLVSSNLPLICWSFADGAMLKKRSTTRVPLPGTYQVKLPTVNGFDRRILCDDRYKSQLR